MDTIFSSYWNLRRLLYGYMVCVFPCFARQSRIWGSYKWVELHVAGWVTITTSQGQSFFLFFFYLKCTFKVPKNKSKLVLLVFFICLYLFVFYQKKRKEKKRTSGKSCLPNYKQFFSKFLGKEINMLATRTLPFQCIPVIALDPYGSPLHWTVTMLL